MFGKNMMPASAVFLTFVTVCTFKTVSVILGVTAEGGVSSDNVAVSFYCFFVNFIVF